MVLMAQHGSAAPSVPDAAPGPGTVSGAGGARVGVAPEPGTTPTPASCGRSVQALSLRFECLRHLWQKGDGFIAMFSNVYEEVNECLVLAQFKGLLDSRQTRKYVLAHLIFTANLS